MCRSKFFRLLKPLTAGPFLTAILALVTVSGLHAQLLSGTIETVAESGYIVSITDRSIRFDTARIVHEETMNKPVADKLPHWKTWALAENFTFGKDRGCMPMIADLHALHPYFRDKIILLIELCKRKGITLHVVESYRTRAKQSEYYHMGRKYTRSTGGKSKHQYGLAVDLVPIVDGEAQWEDKVLWKKIGIIGESLGLRWGGRWRSPYDPAHFEWTGGLTSRDLAMGSTPFILSERYPCLEEDLIFLRECWEAWEVEQASITLSANR